MPHVNLFEATFVPSNKTTMLEWLNNILCCLFGLVKNEINIDRATLWMSAYSYKTVQYIRVNNMVDKHISRDWSYSVKFYNCLQFGERIDADRVAIQLSPDYSNGNTHIQRFKNALQIQIQTYTVLLIVWIIQKISTTVKILSK